MIEFVPFKERASEEQKQVITRLLETCDDPRSFSYLLNMVYNNGSHMPGQHDVDMSKFVKDIKMVVNSRYNKLRVLGTVHHDPSAHPSGIIGQHANYHGEFKQALVVDSYIRFQMVMDPKDARRFWVLDTAHTFHFLVDVPFIDRLQLSPRTATYVYMYVTEHRIVDLPRVYPKSRYGSNKIIANVAMIGGNQVQNNSKSRNDAKNMDDISIVNHTIPTGGMNAKKVLFKGYHYKIRKQGKEKYISTKAGDVRLSDVKKWQIKAENKK